eukprot:92900_1
MYSRRPHTSANPRAFGSSSGALNVSRFGQQRSATPQPRSRKRAGGKTKAKASRVASPIWPSTTQTASGSSQFANLAGNLRGTSYHQRTVTRRGIGTGFGEFFRAPMANGSRVLPAPAYSLSRTRAPIRGRAPLASSSVHSTASFPTRAHSSLGHSAKPPPSQENERTVHSAKSSPTGDETASFSRPKTESAGGEIPKDGGRSGKSEKSTKTDAPGANKSSTAPTPAPPPVRRLSSTKSTSSSKEISEEEDWEEESAMRKSIAGQARLDPDAVVIHVHDEARGVKKDFYCNRKVLLTQMAYFQNYLSSNSDYDDIDISVHCDVKIFEWLVKWMLKSTPAPKFETNNLISLLISSDFLQMEELVTECLEYFRENISSVLKYPVDLSCMNTALLKKISAMFKYHEIDAIEDPKDKIVSKLYMRKLEDLLANKENSLFRCSQCGKLFAAKHSDRLPCSSAVSFVQFNGSVVTRHTPDASWDINKYLLVLRSRKYSWRTVFWQFWALTSPLLLCDKCDAFFPFAEFLYCSHHSHEPIFLRGHNRGFYPCCEAEAHRFDPVPGGVGCVARRHHTSHRQEIDFKQELEILKKHEDAALIEFICPSNPSNNSSLLGNDGTASASKSRPPSGRRRSTRSRPRRASNTDLFALGLKHSASSARALGGGAGSTVGGGAPELARRASALLGRRVMVVVGDLSSKAQVCFSFTAVCIFACLLVLLYLIALQAISGRTAVPTRRLPKASSAAAPSPPLPARPPPAAIATGMRPPPATPTRRPVEGTSRSSG